MQWWQASEKRLALALDGSRGYRGCTIPVAWHLLVAEILGEWKPIWIDLLKALGDRVPADWTVIVMADRGLDARWLYEQIQALGWHRFLRVNAGGKAPPGHKDVPRALDLCASARLPLEWAGDLLYRGVQPTAVYAVSPASTKSMPSRGSSSQTWSLNKPRSPGMGCASGLSVGGSDNKRGGCDFHQTKMERPERAERHWLVLLVAPLWMPHR